MYKPLVTVEYKTTIKWLPKIEAPYEVEKGDMIEVQDDDNGIVLFSVESIVDGTLELEEYSPILVTKI